MAFSGTSLAHPFGVAAQLAYFPRLSCHCYICSVIFAILSFLTQVTNFEVMVSRAN